MDARPARRALPPTFFVSAFGVAVAAAVAAPSASIGEHFNLIETAFVITFLVISLGIHEAAHAWVADLCGDSTAKDLGRITLNPIAHIDPFQTVILPATLYLLSGGQMIFGGAKPVPVAYHRLRHPLRDMALVAIAGPASNFVLAVVFMLALKCAVYLGDYERGQLLTQVLVQSANVNLLLAAFNLLPIPPLDGSRVMAWLLPPALREPYVALERIGLLLVMAFIYFVPGTMTLVVGGMRQMRAVIDVMTGGVWG